MEDKEPKKKDEEAREETAQTNTQEAEDKDLDSARGGLYWRSVQK